jgi:hypothetical protein
MESGVVLAEGVCFSNRAAGPGGCLYPEPALLPSLASSLKLFDLTADCNVYNPMDNRPLAHDWKSVEVVAVALRHPLDQVEIERQLVLFLAWRDTLKKA